MRRFFYILALIAIGFVLGFGFREVKGEVEIKREAKKRRIAYATYPIMKNKSFVIVIFAKDVAPFCEQNLLSVLSQEYDDFRVIYIDNGSTDQTAQKVQCFLQNHDFDGRVSFLVNEKGTGESESLYRAVHACKNNEIVLLLRGDECLAHCQVLDRLNHHFADPGVWMSASEAVLCPTYNKVKGGDHYQAFYAGLFKRIKLQEFLERGKFRESRYEEIISAPLKELAQSHAYEIAEPHFLYQKEREFLSIERQDPYPSLKENPWHDFVSDDEKVALVVFSDNRPMELYAFLESCDRYLENLHSLYVVYHAGNERYERGYEQLKTDFPSVIYVKYGVNTPYDDFGKALRKVVFDREVSTTRFIVFAQDNCMIKSPIDFKEVTMNLKETGAYGFYFCLGNHLKTPPERVMLIQKGIYAWQFALGENEWGVSNAIDMALFRKEDIYIDFLNMKFQSPKALQALWNERADLSRVGLYYDRSKAIRLAHKNQAKELLTFFEEGLKIDIAPVSHIENQSSDHDFEPQLIKR